MSEKAPFRVACGYCGALILRTEAVELEDELYCSAECALAAQEDADDELLLLDDLMDGEDLL